MEREVKIADLAKLWKISVNTTWKRVNKLGLTTVKRPYEGREITYVIMDEELLNKYQVHEGVIKADYEETLSTNEEVKTSNDSEIIERVLAFSKDINEQILSMNEGYNQQIKNLNEELVTYKSKNLLLEDKANREGLYLQEIKDLKKDNEGLKKRFLILLTFTITLTMLFGFYVVFKFFIR